MENIIKKAIGGGYCNNNLDILGVGSEMQTLRQIPYEIICDPLFWQALGKACRWEGKVCPKCFTHLATDKGHEKHTYEWHCNYCGLCEEEWPIEFQNPQIAYALRFHEINLTEGWQKAIAYLQNITK